jgi:ubiquinone/menaquinone biosynthesis C-methylase UbiE
VTATEDRAVDGFTAPNPDDIGTNYDEFADFYNLVASDISFHIGMWSQPGRREAASTVFDLSNKAQERVVEHCIESLALKAGEHLLDIGCGSGAPAIRIAQESGGKATGINVSRGQLAQATDRAKEAGLADRVSFQYGNAMALDFADESFDAALAIDLFPHLSDRQQGFNEAFRVLRPGSPFLLSEFTVRGNPPEDQLGAYLQTFHAMPPITPAQSIELAANAGFELVKSERMTKDVALSTEVIYFLYVDRRDEITNRYGPEVVAELDYVMPLVRSYMRDHLGYYYFLLQKPL